MWAVASVLGGRISIRRESEVHSHKCSPLRAIAPVYFNTLIPKGLCEKNHKGRLTFFAQLGQYPGTAAKEMSNCYPTGQAWGSAMTQFRPSDAKEYGQLFLLASVSLEMVAPMAIGWLLDRTFGWQPWGVIGGALFGMIGGIVHLVLLAQKQDRPANKRPPPPEVE
jgi:hypothetical protein